MHSTPARGASQGVNTYTEVTDVIAAVLAVLRTTTQPVSLTPGWAAAEHAVSDVHLGVVECLFQRVRRRLSVALRDGRALGVAPQLTNRFVSHNVCGDAKPVASDSRASTMTTNTRPTQATRLQQTLARVSCVTVKDARRIRAEAPPNGQSCANPSTSTR